MILIIAAALFVLGVLLEALFHQGVGTPWTDRAAWVLWAVAAILWFVTVVVGHGAG
jgi:hypothetical protein